MKLRIYQEKGKWHWRIVSATGKIVARGGEGYVRRVDLLNALSRIDDYFQSVDWYAIEQP